MSEKHFRWLLGVALLVSACSDPSPAPEDITSDAELSPAPESQATPFIYPGIRQPEMLSVEDANLADDEPVIGVLVDAQPRAYTVEALSAMTTHIVNDLIGDTPVSVTYCDRNDVARVFSQPQRKEPIELELQGWNGTEIMVLLGDRSYAQSSSDIPLEDFPFERTTWGAWKKAHPNTEVFVGQSDTETSRAESGRDGAPGSG